MTGEAITTKEHTEAHGDKIKGYRKLTDEEIALINKAKQAGEDLKALLFEVEAFSSATGDHAIDKRWLAMARTDLQVGIMKLVRSIARPQGF